jgi:hypothetical protein
MSATSRPSRDYGLNSPGLPVGSLRNGFTPARITFAQAIKMNRITKSTQQFPDRYGVTPYYSRRAALNSPVPSNTFSKSSPCATILPINIQCSRYFFDTRCSRVGSCCGGGGGFLRDKEAAVCAAPEIFRADTRALPRQTLGAWTESRARRLALSAQLLTLCENQIARQFRDHA